MQHQGDVTPIVRTLRLFSSCWNIRYWYVYLRNRKPLFFGLKGKNRFSRTYSENIWMAEIIGKLRKLPLIMGRNKWKPGFFLKYQLFLTNSRITRFLHFSPTKSGGSVTVQQVHILYTYLYDIHYLHYFIDLLISSYILLHSDWHRDPPNNVLWPPQALPDHCPRWSSAVARGLIGTRMPCKMKCSSMFYSNLIIFMSIK